MKPLTEKPPTMTDIHVERIRRGLCVWHFHDPDAVVETCTTEVCAISREILSNIQSQLPGGSKVLIERSEIEALAQFVREPCDSIDRMHARGLVSHWLGDAP